MDIEGRHAEIFSLEASIKELHDMFVEMATMVELQREVLDNIEMCCVAALEYVKGSNDEIYQYIKLNKEKMSTIKNKWHWVNIVYHFDHYFDLQH